MKKTFTILTTFCLGMILLFSGAIGLNAQPDIIFLTDDDNDDYNYQFLVDQGFNVTKFWGGSGVSNWGTDTIAMLNASDLVIAGRSINSGEWRDSADRAVWNALTVPLIQISPYAVRNSRSHWFNSGTASHHVPAMTADILLPADGVFDNVILDGNTLGWFDLDSDFLLDLTDDSQGEWVAAIGDTIPLLVRFEADKAFYIGGPDSAVAERVFFGFGIEGYDDVSAQHSHFPLSNAAKQVYLAEICRILGIPQQVAVFDQTNDYDILLITDDDLDDNNYEFLLRQGFKISKFWGGKPVSEWGPDSLALMDDADVVIFGRSVNSGEFADSIDRVYWNAVTSPCIYVSPWHTRSSRNNLFNSTGTYNNEEGIAQILLPGDPIFDGVTLTNDSLVWWDRPSDAIWDNSATSQGTWVAQINDTVPLIVRFDADQAFYAGGPDSAVAERVYFGFGIEPDAYGYFPLSKDAKQVYLAEICRLMGITAPEAVYGALDFTIEFLNNENDFDATQKAWLRDQGFTVNSWYGNGNINTWTADTIDILNNADLVIVGRSVNSGQSQDSIDKAVWNSITAPLIHNSPWACRSSRNNFFNSTSTGGFSGNTEADVILADDPVLEFADITDGKMGWFVNNGDWINDVSGTTQGTWVVAQADTIPFLVRFEPDKAFYAGGPDSAVAERIYFGFGMEPAANYFPLDASAQAVYFAEIMRILGGPISAPVYYNTDWSLAWLEVDPGALDPDFDAEVLEYNVELAEASDQIVVNAIANDQVQAVIEGDGTIMLPAEDITLTVMVTSGIGQTRSYRIRIDQPEEPEPEAIEELLETASVVMYPNPVSSTLTVHSAEMITEVTVLDLRGAVVLHNIANDSSVDLDLSTLKAGTYIIRVQTDSDVSVTKIIKQ